MDIPLQDGAIEDVDIAARMEQSFLDYSMSVIVGRALPDVRDGLKPVQRRILFAMDEAGLRAGTQYRKCASVIGDVMKKYHPHGDSSIYDALVRMAQDFAIREPLVDGRGNFGSIDGDPPAAFRYTESRLSPIAMEMVAGINEDTVDFIPNYDGHEVQPEVLPGRFPNLLVNGATGIAVGMATNIPPHNLVETIDACLMVIADPNVTLDQMMTVLPAPDFPTGARILPGEGIREAYETGRGKITMEAIAATETRSGGMPRIVITEIPYQVNKATLLQKIAGLVKDKKVNSIRDLRDESSRDGMRIVIELKRGEDPAETLEKLYTTTELRTNFNVNFVALVDGKPRTLGLLDAVSGFLVHQRDVLTRRTTFRLHKAEARQHILEGYLIALDNLDEVITTIRESDSAGAAKDALMARFDMSDEQATAVLDMMLRRLAKLEREKIQTEYDELTDVIAELRRILNDPAVLDQVLTEELGEIAETYGTPRRSRLSDRDRDDDDDAPVTLAAQNSTTYVTAGGYAKSVAKKRLTAAHNATDPVVAVLRGAADDTLLCIDDQGGGYRLDLGELDVVSMRQRGSAIAGVLDTEVPTSVAGAVVMNRHAYVLTVSAAGLVKRTARDEYDTRSRTLIASSARVGDRIVAVLGVDDGDELMIAHDGGQAIRFPVDDVNPTGRKSSGVAGINVPNGNTVVAASVVVDAADVVVLGTDGSAKIVDVAEFPMQGRGGKGVLTGVGTLAWAGVCRTLHVPTADGWTTLRPETLTPLARAKAPVPAIASVTGVCVPEDDTPDEAE